MTLKSGASSQPGGQSVIQRGGLTWTASDNGKELTWDEAREFCRGLEQEGRRPWRLPTVRELASLFDRQQTAGIRAIETRGAVSRYPIRMDPAFEPSQVWYWSGEAVEPNRARNYDFFTGVSGSFLRSFKKASGAFCVRRSEAQR